MHACAKRFVLPATLSWSNPSAVVSRELQALWLHTQTTRQLMKMQAAYTCARLVRRCASRGGGIHACALLHGLLTADSAHGAEDKRQYAARHGYHVVEFDNVAAEHKRPLASVYSRLLGALSVIRMFDWIWIVSVPGKM